MSNERDESPMTVDESLARAYRDVADERVPEHLDRAVLDRATRAARPGYARSRAWTRPLAWAATIALSVAIVLELTRGPALDEPASWEAPASLDETRSLVPSDASRPAESASSAEGRSIDLIPDPREKSSPALKTSTPVIVESMAVEAKQEADEPASPEARSDFADDRKSAGGAPAAELQRRASQAMEESAGAPAPLGALDPEPAAVAIDADTAVSDPAQCLPEATQQPSTWLECIERLERAGLVDEAAEERRRLRDAFPGFELP